jgi:predicted membrane channel-forming protein YqfA (hemolysin III family)
MKKLRIWASVCMALAIAALVSLLFMHLALTDIYHGENDTSLEWTFLRLGFLVIVFLIVATFISTGLVFKHFRDLDEKEKPRLKD